MIEKLTIKVFSAKIIVGKERIKMFKRIIPAVLLILLFVFTIHAVQAMQITVEPDQTSDSISGFGAAMRNFVASIQKGVDKTVNNALEQGGLGTNEAQTP